MRISRRLINVTGMRDIIQRRIPVLTIVAAGLPAFMIEAGGAFSIVEDSVIAGTDAVLSVQQRLEMIEGPERLDPHPAIGEPLRYTNRPLCTSSGLIRFCVSLRQEIKEGQPLAQVYSAIGSREESLKATANGFVLGPEDHARVLPGREVIAIAEHS